jgi:glycosyltransferase involved in cell wall biosynthesis
MDPATPSISIVIPTLNAARVLGRCLESIAAQDYPRERLELIIADGGSTDGTLELCRRYTDRIFPNPLRTGEAGKAVGVRQARHELVALIDSDNILPDPGWLRRMVEPFREPDVVGSEPIAFTYRRSDPAITRYCALMGMNDPLCYFLGNYDRLNALSGRWTGLPVPTEDRGGYLTFRLDPRWLPTIGANGTLLRRAVLEQAGLGDYLFDIDVLYQLACRGEPVRFAKVKTGIVHLYTSSLRGFARKQRRRIQDYLYYRRQGLRQYPWQRQSRAGLARFVLSTLLVLPLVVQAARGYRRQPDPAWALHVPACWVTLWTYGWGWVAGQLRPQEVRVERSQWQQS